MSLAKVVEVIGEGDTIEHAVNDTVTRAAKTIHSIKSIYLDNIQAIVENNKVARYRINAKITFVMDDQ